MPYREDCRYYNGEKPCSFKCEGGCQNFAPFGTRILIIKLGAIGDVLRTTPILPVLKAQHPSSHITWLVEELGAPLLEHNTLIDKVLTPSLGTLARLQVEKFDLLYCLDKVDLATGLAVMVNTTQKLGFGMNEFGTMTTFSAQGEYARVLGLSDHKKFHVNTKPYQQNLFESLGWEYTSTANEYVVPLDENEVARARESSQTHDLESLVAGINTGAGPVFAGKAWRVARIAELCRRVYGELGARVLLLGGPGERNREAGRRDRHRHANREFPAALRCAG